MNAALIDAAHDPDYDCAYNAGRNCDCGAAADTVARIMPVLLEVIDKALNDVLEDVSRVNLASATVLTTVAKARTYIRRALA